MQLTLSSENIKDVKESLAIVADLPYPQNKEALIELRKIYPAELLKASYLLMTNDQKQVIYNLTLSINREAGVIG